VHWLLLLALGDLGNLGNRWWWSGTNEVFVPQLVMYATPPHFYRNPGKIDRDIETFLVGHGFNGFHVFLSCRWFDIEADDCRDVPGSDPPLDSRTFDALEMLIRKTHDAGGMVHLWMWGDEQRGQTPTSRPDWGGLDGPVARRVEAEIARRLGPLPGWSMGYGFDLDEWVTAAELKGWRDRMQDRMPRFHFLGGRPKGPNRGRDHGRYAVWNEWLDYASYEHHRPTYSVYVAALEQNPDKPVLSEDRFRVLPDRSSKHYSTEEVRRGLWHSTLAGGVGNIWGYLLEGGSHELGSAPFPNREEIRTHFEFLRGRFTPGMSRCGPRRADPRETALGLCSSVEGRYVFYQEDAERVELELRSMPARAPAVAVDARRPYRERPLGELAPGVRAFEAPYRSDWAVAVGEFAREASLVSPSTSNAPNAPGDLVVLSGSGRSVELAFDDRSDDERGFELERAASRGDLPGPFERIATLPPNTTRFSDTSLRPRRRYWYRVRAVHDRGASGYSGTSNVLPMDDGTLLVDLRPSSLRPALLERGDAYYVDRDYALGRIPPELEGATWIRTANDGKEIDAERFVSFQVTRAVTVYVGFDRRAKKRPSWLTEWVLLTERIEVDRDGMGYFDLYRRDVPAGTVSLGGNSAPPADWEGEGRSHYVIALVPGPLR
jgi:hypothetical protein